MRNDIVVVDANIVIKWILNEPDSGKAVALLTQWSKTNTTILAPALLAYEATNILHQHVRNNRQPIDVAKNGIINVVFSAIKLELHHDAAFSIRALELAHQFKLPATYDAHYLALAEREGCELWTADTRMWRAIRGQLAWVQCLDGYQPS